MESRKLQFGRQCAGREWTVEFLLREGREGGEVAERRDDNSPAIHGWVRCQTNEKSREGR